MAVVQYDVREKGRLWRQIELCNLSTFWSWASYLNSLSLGSPICEMDTVIILLTRVVLGIRTNGPETPGTWVGAQ